jgi:uncharacterized protein
MIADLPQRLKEFFDAHPIPALVAVYLFGSQAEGRAHRESDVDVAILLAPATCPSERDRFALRVALGSDLMQALSTNLVDVVILNDAPPLFGRRIVTEGRCVFETDKERHQEFVRNVQLRAADFEPFFRRMQRLKLEALAS